jgi:hypothetical protein
LITIPIALFCWPVFVFCLGLATRLHIAILIAYFGAWLFLPMVSYSFSAALPYDKWTAAMFGSLACSITLGGSQLISWRPSWLDLPMLAWCIAPLLSNTFGGYGAYEGLCGTVGKLIQWGIPYLLGRAHFRDRSTITDLAKAFVVAGLIYMPFCWYEIRMSPQLHLRTYGMVQHEWSQLRRSGGFRPIIYMQHAIAVSTFFSIVFSFSWWLWRSGTMTRIGNFPIWILMPLFAFTIAGCKTLNAYFLAALSVGLYTIQKMIPHRGVLVILVMIPLFYMTGKLTGVLGDELLLQMARAIDSERAGSLEQRLYSERVILNGLKASPIFGNGRWGDTLRSAEQDVGRTVVPDAYWVIVAGSSGLFGLAAYASLFLLPILRIAKQLRTVGWLSPYWVPVSALIVGLMLYYLDCLMNAMLSSVFPLTLGALTALATSDDVASAYELSLIDAESGDQ